MQPDGGRALAGQLRVATGILDPLADQTRLGTRYGF